MKQFPKHPLTMSLAERESEIFKFETQERENIKFSIMKP